MPEVLTHVVLESPWPLVGVLVVAAAAVQVVAMQRGGRRALLAAPVLLLLAGAVALAGWWVETGNEAVERQTRELIAATAPLDRATLAAHLADDIRLMDPTGAVWLAGPAVEQRLASLAERRALDQRVVSLGVETPAEQPARRRVVLELRTRDASGVPILSAWSLVWRPVEAGGSADWELMDVQWLSLAGQSPDRSLIR